MALIKVNCDNCGRLVDMMIGQHFDGIRLMWNAGYRCLFCQHHAEMDDQGVPPAHLRQAILDQEGEWELIIADQAADLPHVLKILRAALDLTLSESSKIRHRIPGSVTSGTNVEMQRLAYLLAKDGVQSTRQQL